MLARNFLGSRDLIEFFPLNLEDIEEHHWSNLIREATPDVYSVVCSPFLAPVGKGSDEDDCGYSVATAASESSGEIFSNEDFPTVFGAYIPHAESAHLISAGQTCWPYFAFSVVPFLGKKLYERVRHSIETLDENIPKAELKVLYGLINGIVEKGNTKKTGNTGIKNSIVNRIRFPSQGFYFDKQPRIMFLPILTLEGARKWNGEGYKAILLVNTNSESHAELPQIVSAVVGILDRRRLLTLQDAEIELFTRACQFLKNMVLGLVYCTAKFQPDKRLEPPTRSDRGGNPSQSGGTTAATQGEPPRPVGSSRELHEFLVSASRLREEKDLEVQVPCTKPDGVEKLQNGTLLVVDFGDQAEAEAKKKPLAPDPMLLGMRSAVNYLRFHSDLRILPTSPTLDDVDSVDSSADGSSSGLSEVEFEVENTIQHRFLPVDSNASVPGMVAVTPFSEIEDDESSDFGL